MEYSPLIYRGIQAFKDGVTTGLAGIAVGAEIGSIAKDELIRSVPALYMAPEAVKEIVGISFIAGGSIGCGVVGGIVGAGVSMFREYLEPR